MGDYIPFRPDMQIVFTSFTGSEGLHKMMQIDKAGSQTAGFSFVICLMYLQKHIEIGMDLCYDLCGNIS